MIVYHRSVDGRLTTIDGPVPGCWIDAFDPTSAELAELALLGLPSDYLTYPLDINELSRTERDDGVVLVILRVPVFHGVDADVPYGTVPLGVIITDQYIVTVCAWHNDVHAEFSSGRVRGLGTAKRYRFLLRLLLVTATAYLRHLNEITRAVDALEDQLQASTRNREVLELLKYQKSLTYFTTALRSNQLMMERLQRSHLLRTFPDDEDLLEDVITENQQAIEMTSISSNILSSMMDAFASIISNNLNAVMKLLASITIVLSLPTMIASFFGMNVDLPLQEHPQAFAMTLALTAAIAGVAVVIFWRRDWF